jgi:hypothetical protein
MSGKVSMGSSSSARFCPTFPPGNHDSSSESLSETTIFIPLKIVVSTSTSFLNTTFNLSYHGDVTIGNHSSCPPPVLNSTGYGSDFCGTGAAVSLEVYVYIYDRSNGSELVPANTQFLVDISGSFQYAKSCAAYYCSVTSNSGSILPSPGWHNGSSTLSISLSGPCTWYQAYHSALCHHTGGALGLVASHHYAVVVQVQEYTGSEVQGWKSTASATFQNSGPTRGDWLTSISAS